MVEDISIRKAQPGDYEFARRVHPQAMRPHVERLFGWDDASRAERFRSEFSLDGASVIRRGNEDVGWLQVLEDADSIYLRQLFILPEFQNRGVGTAVLTRLQAAWSSGKAPVTLGLLKGSPARRFYERHGFKVVRDEAHRTVLRWHASDR